MVNGKQIKDGTITASKLSLTDPSSSNDPAIKSWVETQIANSLYGQDWKPSVRVASTANVNISSAPSSIDGVTLSIGNRVGLPYQSTASQNGIYVFNGSGSPMTRATDADSSSEVTPGMAFYVEEGTVNAKTAWKLTNSGAITLGTTALVFEAFTTLTTPVWTVSNKGMAASTTTSDFDQACSTIIAGTPANDSYVIVAINGLLAIVGDGVKTKECYFSADSGSTAKSISTIASGDRLYWVGSVAGYQLATTDIIDFIYEV